MTSLSPEAAVGQAKVRSALLVLAWMATLITLLPAFLGASVEVAGLARLAVVILACVLVYQGRLWARWVLVLFSGLVGAVAVLQAFRAELSLIWRFAFAVLGIRILLSLRTLYFNAEAKSYFNAVAAPQSSEGRGA